MADVRPLAWMSAIQGILAVVLVLLLFVYDKYSVLQPIFVPVLFISMGTMFVWSTVVFIQAIITAYAGLEYCSLYSSNYYSICWTQA